MYRSQTHFRVIITGEAIDQPLNNNEHLTLTFRLSHQSD